MFETTIDLMYAMGNLGNTVIESATNIVLIIVLVAIMGFLFNKAVQIIKSLVNKK